jgi:hypothetical protein
MSEIYITQDKSSQELFLLTNKTRKVAGWDDAIALARERLESLKAVIEVFEGYRAAGEPFSGESRHDSVER